MPRSGSQNDLRRGHLARSNIQKGRGSIRKGPMLGPVQIAQAAIKYFLRRVTEILCGIGIGSNERDFLKRHPPDIKPAGIFAEADVHDHTARFHHRRRNCARRGVANGIDNDPVGINDAIAVIAALHDDEGTARGDVDATVEVVVRSTRHILATTVTTVAGFLPLLLGGEAFWRPLGLAISGGVAGATIVALILVPSLYRLLYIRRARRLATGSS